MTEPVTGRKPVWALLMQVLCVTTLVLPAIGSQAGVVFTNLYSFHAFPTDGANPQAGLVQGSDGNFYGTTAGGGASSAGTVFKITANGALTSLYSFTGTNNDGAMPRAGLVQAYGDFYGTTEYGGISNLGTVFRITTNGALFTLHHFDGYYGANPEAGLVQGSNGDFYGTTTYGGLGAGLGTVFEITTDGRLLLVAFFGYPAGWYPHAGLVQGSDGNFYGSTYSGGTNGSGTVFTVIR
jgi:uncharacterized repeat protein (TIGR03803 family)